MAYRDKYTLIDSYSVACLKCDAIQVGNDWTPQTDEVFECHKCGYKWKWEDVPAIDRFFYVCACYDEDVE